MDVIGWRVPPVTSRRFRDPMASSGVGMNLSGAWDRRGWHMYRVRESLLELSIVPSLMNPDERRSTPIRSLRFVDGEAASRKVKRTDLVTASLASIPQREAGLRKVVQSIAPQVDALCVYLNGYAAVPKWLSGLANVAIFRSQEHGDIGDAGKFFPIDEIEATTSPWTTTSPIRVTTSTR